MCVTCWLLVTLLLYSLPLPQCKNTGDDAHLSRQRFRSIRAIKEMIENYEVLIPTVVFRDSDMPYPNKIIVKVPSKREIYKLILTKNQMLISEQFKSILIDKNGNEILDMTAYANCYYQGEVEGYPDWTATMSTCNGMQGDFGNMTDAENFFHIEPLDRKRQEIQQLHALYLETEYAVEAGGCTKGIVTEDGKILKASMTDSARIRRQSMDTSFVEWVIVNDHQQYTVLGEDANTAVQRSLSVTNAVDITFRPLNIRVVLIRVITFTDSDQFTVNLDAAELLFAFTEYFRTTQVDTPYDSAMLLTGHNLDGNTIGIAFLGSMCNRRLAFGVTQDGGGAFGRVASTAAHELGHIFDMDHDDGRGCTCPDPTCVMNSFIAFPYPTIWSSCSADDLNAYLALGGGTCLFNMPIPMIPGTSYCGNNFLEDGEACDCGTPAECTNVCCNASTCEIITGKECAFGECCNSQCLFSAYGHECRASSGDCDIAEYCPGNSGECPEDIYRANGVACSSDNGYCMEGACPTHEEQCRDAFNSDTGFMSCYNENTIGNASNNCGRDSTDFRPCEPDNVLCGMLQCMEGHYTGIYRVPGVVTTTVTSEGTCNGFSSNSGVSSDEMDQGQVTDGSKCGESMVCDMKRCMTMTSLGLPLPCPLGSNSVECSGPNNGVCTNRGTCSCNFGFMGMACETIRSVIDCGPLRNPPNGLVNHPLTTEGGFADYSCNTDFLLVGTPTRRCLLNGSWSETEPTCQGYDVTLTLETVVVNVTEPKSGNTTSVSMCYHIEINMPLTRDSFFDLTLLELTTASISQDFLLSSPNPLTIVSGSSGNQSGCIDFAIIGNQEIEDPEVVVYMFSARHAFDRVLFPTNVTTNSLTLNIFDNLGIFFPFGDLAGDESLMIVDDGTSPGQRREGLAFPYYGADFESIFWVNSNGVISFRKPFDRFQFSPFQVRNILMAPFYNDIDITVAGRIYYRFIQDPADLNRVDMTVRSAFANNYTAAASFVATWDRVAEFTGSADVVNSFQAVLTTNGQQTYAFFLYRQIQWGSLGSVVGFSAGDTIRSFTLARPSTEYSNIVDERGIFVFRVDQNDIMLPSANFECDFLQSPVNGLVSHAFPVLGTVAEYSCKSTFRLNGVRSRTCLMNSTWSGEAPTCEALAENEEFFLSLPISPAGQTAAFDVIIGTPSIQAEYVIESISGSMVSGTITLNNPEIIRVSITRYQVDSSSFSDRMNGIKVRGTSGGSLYVILLMQYNVFSFFPLIIAHCSFSVRPNSILPNGGAYVYYAISTARTEAVTDRQSFVLLVATKNQTTISITPTQIISMPENPQDHSVSIDVAAGTTYNLTLDALQTIGFLNSLDLTGTKIVSDKPLTVISGRRCAQIPSTSPFCEPIFVHVPPIFNWGESFLLAPFGGRNASQYYKLVMCAESTTVTYRCSTESSEVLQILGAGTGHFLSIPANSYCYLRASSPIFMVQLAPGYLEDFLGDPALAVVAPLAAHVNGATLFSFQTFQQNFITVTVSAEHFNAAQIQLDGIQLSCTWNDIYNIINDEVVGHGCTSNVAVGTHTVSHTEEDGLLSVSAYGWSDNPALGYAYLPGYNFQPPGPAVFIPLTLEAVEGDDRTVQVCVSLRLHPARLTTDNKFIVTLSTQPVSAMDDDDYEPAINISKTIPMNSASGINQCLNVTLIDDGLVEGNETFMVILDPEPGVDVTLDNNVTVITIVDNEVAVVSLPSSTLIAEDEGGRVCAALVLNSGSFITKAIIVQLTTMQAGSAIASVDYDDITASLTFAENSVDSTMQCVNVTTTDDTLIEGNEEFTATLSLISSGVDVMLGRVQSIVTIVDDDTGMLSLTNTINFVSESGRAEVCIILTILEGTSTANAITFTIATMSGSATADADYETLAMNLTFLASVLNGTMQCLNISIIEDILVERDENFTVNIELLDSDIGITLQNDSAEVIIRDNEVASVFLPSSQTLTEHDTIIPVCVTLMLSPSALTSTAEDITVTLNTNNSSPVSATPNVDYQAMIPAVLMFPAGSSSGVTQCTNITLFEDSNFEYDETIALILTTSENYVTLGNDETVITIMNDEQISLEIFNVPRYVSEDIEEVFLLVRLIVPNDTEREIVFRVVIRSSTAEDGFDYFSDTILYTFPSGSTFGDELYVNISVLDDSLVEGEEMLTLGIESVDPSVQLMEVQVNITILDNEGIRVSFDSSEVVIQENIGTTELCASLEFDPGTALANAVTILPFIFPVTTDAVLAKNLTFIDNSTQCLNLTVIDDTLVEGTETFVVNLTVVSREVNAAFRTVEVVIEDNEAASVSLPENLVVSEDIEIVEVCASLIVALGTVIDNMITVAVATLSGSAISSMDYLAFAMNLTLPVNSVNGTERCFNLTILEDSLVEGNEMFIVTQTLITTGLGVSLGNNTVTTITIMDNEVPRAVLPAMMAVAEDDGFVKVCITLSIPLGTTVADSFSIELTTLSGSAMAKADFYSLSMNLTFPTNSTNGDFQCLNVTIMDDSLVEGNETFMIIMNLMTIETEITLDRDNSTTVTIVDNEAATVSLVHMAVSVFEDVGMVQVCSSLTLDAGTAIANTVTVVPTITPDSSLPDASLTMNFTFTENSTECVNATIDDDTLVEGDETISIRLSSVTPSVGVTILINNTAMITIRDNEVALVSWMNSTMAFAEDAGIGQICAELMFDSGTALANSITVTPTFFNSVLADLVLTMNFTFTENSIECINITIVDDTLVEGDETFTVVLSLVTTGKGVILGNTSTGLIRITDNEAATVSLLADSLTVPEDAGTVQICALLTITSGTDIANTIVAMPSILQESAESDADLDMNFTFVESSSQCLNLSITDDTLVEGFETFHVVLTLLTVGVGVILDSNNTAMITVIDNEAAIVSTLSPELTISEDIGTVQICASLTIISGTSIANTVTLMPSILPVTADATISTNFTFTEASVKCMNATIIDDTLVEGDETFVFSLNLVTIGIGVSLGSNRSTIITIKDNEGIRVSLIPTDLTVNEETEFVQVCASLEIDSGTAIANAIPLAPIIVPDSAAVDAIINENFTFTENSTLCLNLTIIDDSLVEGDEIFTVNLTLLNIRVDTVFENATVVTIEDNEAATVLLPNILIITEDSGTSELCAELTFFSGTAVSNEITLTIASVSDSAMADIDYREVAKNLTFPENSINGTIRCVNVTTNDDTLVEGDETFSITQTLITTGLGVTLASDINEGLGVTEMSTKISIIDNEEATVALPAAITVAESNGYVEICVSLSISNGTAVENPFTVILATLAGSAVADTDYNSQSLNLTFAANSSHGSTQCMNVSIVDDMLVEGNETFTVILTQITFGVGVQMGSNTSTIITIEDEEGATVSLVPMSVTIDEDVGIVPVCASLIIDLGTALGNTVTVTPTIVPDSANDDAMLMQNFTFTEESIECLNVTIFDDSVLEGSESFYIRLLYVTANAGVTLVHINTSFITITDNEAAIVSLLTTSIIVSEDAALGQICASLTFESGTTSLANTITVTIFISDLASDDLTLTMNFTFTESSIECVNLTIADNTLVEGDKTFPVTLILVTIGFGVTLGTNTTGTITITDNEAARILLPFTAMTLAEDAGIEQVCASLVIDSGTAIANTIIVMPIIDPASSSVELALNFTFMMNSGNSTQCLNMTVIDDMLVEGNETLSVELSLVTEGVGVTLGSSIAVITIVDNEAATVSIFSMPSTVAEDAAQVMVCTELVIHAGAALANTITVVPIIQSDSTNSDVAILTNFTFTEASTSCPFLTFTDDTLVEGDETVTVELYLATIGKGVTLGSDTTKTIIILDNEAATLSLLSTAIAVDEDVGTSQVCLALVIDEGTGIANAITVVSTIKPGSVADIGPLIRNSTFTENSTQCLNVTIIDDALVEGNESFIMALTLVTSGLGVVLGSNNSTEITVVDDEAAFVSLHPTTLSISEDLGFWQVCAALTFHAGSDALANNITVTLVSTSAALAQFTFSEDSSQCLNVTIHDDSLVEGNEIFTVMLNLITTGAGVTLGENYTTTITIVDDEGAIINIPPSLLVDEGDGVVQICAVLIINSGTTIANTITATPTITQGSAIAFSDYEHMMTNNLTFAANSSNGDMQCLTVTIIEDDLLEGEEAFSVSLELLTMGKGVQLGNSTIVVSIWDNEVAMISLPNDLVVIPENNGAVQVCASLSIDNVTTSAITITLATVQGSARADVDYEASVMNLTFPENSADGDVQCMIVALWDDALLEGDETFTVTSSLVTMGMLLAVLGRDRVATVKILDNEAGFLSLPTGSIVVSEVAGFENLCVTLELAVNVSTASTIILSIYSLSVSATENIDYEAIVRNLTFSTNSTNGDTQCLNVSITDDTLVEMNETFSITLTLVTTGLYITILNNITTFIIEDNEGW